MQVRPNPLGSGDVTRLLSCCLAICDRFVHSAPVAGLLLGLRETEQAHRGCFPARHRP